MEVVVPVLEGGRPNTSRLVGSAREFVRLPLLLLPSPRDERPAASELEEAALLEVSSS